MTVTSASHVARAPYLAVLGDLVLDVVVRPDREMERGTDVAGTLRFHAGGSAANTARAFARLGGRATFIGAVGGDSWGQRLVRSLRANGVTVHAVSVDAPTARLAAYIGPDGERSFVTERAAADRLSAQDVESGWLRRVDALHLPAYSLFAEPLSGAAAKAAALVREAGGLVSVDLASRAPLVAIGRRAARAAIAELEPDVVFGNAEEAAALSRKRPDQRLLDLAPLAVVKGGAAGCRVLRRGPVDDPVDEMIVFTKKPLALRDTTGAGDAFDAGFLFRLLGHLKARPDAASRPPSWKVLRRAAVSGHRAAAELLTAPRPVLAER